MRILHLITPRHVSGAELLALRIVLLETKQGHDVRMLTKPHAAFLERAKSAGADIAEAPISGKFNPRALPAVREEIERFRPDVVCTHLTSATLWGALAAKSCGVPSVAMVHGFTNAFCYRFPQLLVCVSEAVAADIRKQSVPESHIRVVHNGIDPEPFLSGPVAELALPEGAVCVGVVAHLAPKKGFYELVEAMKRLPDIHFVVVGQGEMQEWLEEQNRTELGGRLHLIGFRDDIPALMRRFDIFCLPSRREPFGLVILEAMAAGRPVTAFRSGGAPEVILEGETGLLAEPGDAEGLAAALRRLADDPELRRRMGEEGRKRVLCRFTLEQTVENLHEVFREAQGAKRPL